jgi:hypothetical protein
MPVDKKRRPAAAAVIVAVLFASSASAQDVIAPDLKTIPEGKDWKIHNRSVAVVEQDGKTVAEFDGRPGDGMVWVEGLSFTNGVIECDLLGRSAPVQGSFIGIAFGVKDAGTYDAVYFRPFNFRSEDAGRRAHSVQYVSHPEWTWGRLRQERPGRYEQAIEPPPDGDRWFHVRIVVRHPKISVYFDDAEEPCLEVESLGGPRTGSVALWTGNNSPGRFANLKISKANPGL